MLNPLVAAQSQLYTIQQNINNAFTDGYHRRSSSTESTPFSKYVDLNVSRSGDLYSDMLLNSSLSKQEAAKQTSTSLSNLSAWLDGWAKNKPNTTTINGTPDVSAVMNWYNSGLSEAESNLNSSTNSLSATLNAINSTLKSIADTNQATLDGHSSDELKDVQSQLLSSLSQYVSVNARYDGGQLSVSLPSGEPLVLGTNSSSLSTSGTGTTLSFQKSNIALDSNRLSGAISSMYQAKDTWQSTVDNIAAARNSFALKTNSWNVSNGGSNAYNLTAGNMVASTYNNGDINVPISLNGSISDLNSTALTNSNGIKTGNLVGNFENITSLKIENSGGTFKIYTKTTESNNWSLKASDVNLNTAIGNFNGLGNQSLTLGSATINTASLSGDSWTWNANNSSISQGTSLQQSIAVGMSRIDNMNNNANLTFKGNDSDYTFTASLNLSISNSNTINGFPNGSVVRVGHQDGTFNDFTVAGGIGPTWEDGATYKYNGSKWQASGSATQGNTWTIQQPTKQSDASMTKVNELSADTLNIYRSNIGVSASSATTSYKLAQTYYQNAQNNWQSENGVNLDEEAQALAKTQQWYEALAKSEGIKNSLWDTLINSI